MRLQVNKELVVLIVFFLGVIIGRWSTSFHPSKGAKNIQTFVERTIDDK
jgi:hypothetical protein